MRILGEVCWHQFIFRSFSLFSALFRSLFSFSLFFALFRSFPLLQLEEAKIKSENESRRRALQIDPSRYPNHKHHAITNLSAVIQLCNSSLLRLIIYSNYSSLSSGVVSLIFKFLPQILASFWWMAFGIFV